MTNLIKNEKILKYGAGMILISMLFMLIVLPAAYTETLPNENNTGALIGISLAAVIRLTLFLVCLRIINLIKKDGGKRKNKDYLWIIAVLLFFFGFIYSDGAFSFQNNEPKYISYFMFGSVICDFLATFLLILGMYLKRK